MRAASTSRTGPGVPTTGAASCEDEGAAVRTLLAADRRPVSSPGLPAAAVDHVRRGAVARRYGRTVVRRAEPGPCGPLLLEAQRTGGVLELRVFGSAATPAVIAEAALEATRWWVGLHDDPSPLDAAVAGVPALRRALARVGPVRLGRLPAVGEALVRSVLHQLVQGAEAIRSVAQVAAGFGTPCGDLHTFPGAAVLGATPAWALRRCGVSLQGARAVHAASLADARLRAALDDGMPALDRRLRALPGVGVWTSAETRLALGDPDAVSVGDYHVHKWVSWTLAGVDPRESSDALMLHLLAPFAGQRGRVIRLIGRAYARGVLDPPPRRGPHAAFSAHRYW